MNSFKIGDKVKLKGTNEFLGFVSNVFKGQLFLLNDFEISVHLNGTFHTAMASELEVYVDE
jgi:hypothetical protein